VKRLVTFGILVFALGAAGAAAADGGSWSKWEPTYQGPISTPAGTVCSFPVTAEPVRQNLRIRYHYDEAGNQDGYQVVGPLIARVTNTATGESVVRNLSGHGTVMFQPDGSWDAVVNGGFLIFFRAGDEPANALLFFHGHTVLHGTPTGQKTLVSYTGRGENLCDTLA
jgi:hypothetical protein